MPTVYFTADEAKATAAFQRMEDKVQKLEQRLREVGRAGQESSERMESALGGVGRQVATVAAGYLTVTTTLNAAKGAFDLWINNLRRIGEEATKANEQVVTLAALQSPGHKQRAVMLARELGTTFGITDYGQAFGTVEALQAMRKNSLEQGIVAAEQVFRLMQLGVEHKDAMEAEIIGAARGMPAGEFSRLTFAAGIASGRGPKTIAKAIPGMNLFKDPTFAFAAASVLADTFGEEVETFVKAAGISLSGQDDAEWMRFLKRKGLAGKSEVEMLTGLHRAGVRSIGDLQKAGLSDIRKLQATETLLKNMEKVLDVQAQIVTLNQPGILERARGDIESELGETALVRRNRVLRARQQDAMAFGPAALDALEQEQEDRITGEALTRMGLLNIGPVPLVDEEGRATPYGRLALQYNDVADRVKTFISAGTPNEYRRRMRGGGIMDHVRDVEGIIRKEVGVEERMGEGRNLIGVLESIDGAMQTVKDKISGQRPATLARPDADPGARSPGNVE